MWRSKNETARCFKKSEPTRITAQLFQTTSRRGNLPGHTLDRTIHRAQPGRRPSRGRPRSIAGDRQPFGAEPLPAHDQVAQLGYRPMRRSSWLRFFFLGGGGAASTGGAELVVPELVAELVVSELVVDVGRRER